MNLRKAIRIVRRLEPHPSEILALEAENDLLYKSREIINFKCKEWDKKIKNLNGRNGHE